MEVHHRSKMFATVTWCSFSLGRTRSSVPVIHRLWANRVRETEVPVTESRRRGESPSRHSTTVPTHSSAPVRREGCVVRVDTRQTSSPHLVLTHSRLRQD